MTIRTRSALMGAFICASAGFASAGVVGEFALSDHPDGSAAPPPYGLRLDGIFGGGATTFSFVDVTLTVSEDDMTGDLSINIAGEVFGGEVSGGSYVGGGDSYTVNFDYITGVESYNGGWRVVGTNPMNTGTLTPTAGSPDSIYTLTDDNSNAFVFAPDGHRLSGDNSSWVGRGWMTPNSDGTGVGGSQDWLFVGTPIPAPGTFALAGLGMLAGARRRR